MNKASDSTTPVGEADRLLQQGVDASRAGNPDTALALLRQAGGLQPGSAVPQFLIGSELAQLGQIAQAESALANAVLLAPAWHIARYQLGLLQFTAGRVSVALITWSPLFELPPSSALRRFVNGFAALAHDDLQHAIVRFREGLALNRENEPLNGDVRLLIDRIENSLGAGSASQAVQQPAISTPAQRDEPEADVHVLLSNYAHQGPLH